MLDDSLNTGADSRKRLDASEQKNLSDSLRTLVGWIRNDTLGGKLTRILGLFDKYFGDQSTQPWTDSAQRGVVLIGFVCSVKMSVYKEASDQRESDSLAASFFEKLDRELESVIPLVDARAREQLLESPYPLGSGDGSLANLCFTSELKQNGAKGAISLLARYYRSSTIPTSLWTEDLLRACKSELACLDRKAINAYTLGLAGVFFKNSPLVSRVDELFLGISKFTPFEKILHIYQRLQANNRIAKELKRVLLREILDGIEDLTGILFKSELEALRKADFFPPLSQDIVTWVHGISRSRKNSRSVKTSDVGDTRKVLNTALETLPNHKKHSSNPIPAIDKSHQPVSRKNPGVIRIAAEHSSLKGGFQSPVSKEMAKKLNELPQVDLPQYISEMVSAGIKAPDPTLLQNFPGILEGVELTRLLIIRNSLVSPKNMGSDPKLAALLTGLKKVAMEHLEGSLLTLPDKYSAREMVNVYLLCKQSGATERELGTIKAAIRKCLKLPEGKHRSGEDQLSMNGQRVWKWLFSDMPRDRGLLDDYFHARLDQIMSDVARDLSTNPGQGSVLDVVLKYARQLNRLETYHPGSELLGVGMWRLSHFTAAVRKELGNSHVLAKALTSSIREQLLTKEVKKDDAFPPSWRDFGRTSEIVSLCSQIESSIASEIHELDLERSSVLVVNLNVLARRGPDSFRNLLPQARETFMNHVWRMSDELLRSLPTETLVRIVQGLDACRHRDLAVLSILSQECVIREARLSAREFVTVAESFANLVAGDDTFWSSFASFVEKKWGSFLEERLLSTLWSFAVKAPEKVPVAFDTSFLPLMDYSFNHLRVTQTLIALGRYRPERTDPAYQQLAMINNPHKMSQAEKKLLGILPALLEVPKTAIFPQVNVGGFETDFVVDFGHRRLIIELDGDLHFLLGPDGNHPQGRDKFQDMVFKNLGYEVFHLPLGALYDRERGLECLRKLKEMAIKIAADVSAKHLGYLENLKVSRN